MLNHLKFLNSQKLTCVVGLFGLKRFHGLVSLAQFDDMTDCLSSVLFCIIILFLLPAAVKALKKDQYAPTRTYKGLNNIT